MANFLEILIIGISNGGVYALIALGFVIIYKATRVINFAYGSMMVLGACFLWSCLAQFGLPLWLSLIIAFGFGAAMGFIIDRSTMRPLIGQPVMASVVVTLALFGTLKGVTLLIWGGAPLVFPVEIIPQGTWHIWGVNLSQLHIYSFLASVIFISLLILYFEYTNSGLAMKVTAEDHVVAQSLGIRVKSVFSITWMIAGVLAIVGGIFLTSAASIVDLVAELGLKGLAVMLLGGLESIHGAIIAGIIVGICEVLASIYLSVYIGGGIGEVFPFMLMVIVLIIRPYGLFGLVKIERI